MYDNEKQDGEETKPVEGEVKAADEKVEGTDVEAK